MPKKLKRERDYVIEKKNAEYELYFVGIKSNHMKI